MTAHYEDQGFLALLNKRRCKAPACRRPAQGAGPFCSDCAPLVPAEMKRVLVALPQDAAGEIQLTRACRAIALKRGLSTVPYDGALRRLESVPRSQAKGPKPAKAEAKPRPAKKVRA